LSSFFACDENGDIITTKDSIGYDIWQSNIGLAEVDFSLFSLEGSKEIVTKDGKLGFIFNDNTPTGPKIGIAQIDENTGIELVRSNSQIDRALVGVSQDMAIVRVETQNFNSYQKIDAAEQGIYQNI
jgi:hypothetical protein